MRRLPKGVARAAMALLLLLGGCGQKGPLYLPEKGGAVVTTPAAPAPPATEPAPVPPPQSTPEPAPAATPPTPAKKTTTDDEQAPK
ncbi:MAG TPA: lipoprotein [Steroidobacteraceae bacterium]|nr:lipoprotein [Steroidobacteraceae bacterium]